MFTPRYRGHLLDFAKYLHQDLVDLVLVIQTRSLWQEGHQFVEEILKINLFQ